MSDSPAKTTSEELDERHRELAREEGEAYQRALRHMVDAVAHSGAMTEVGDFVVGVAQEKAEGMYRRREGALQFVEPTTENCHLEVAVADVADGRFVPHLDVDVTLTAEDGETVGPTGVPFVWHPGLHHYGVNLELPGDGAYDVEVRVAPATFPRHDRENGNRYDEAVEVTFDGLDVACGRA